MPIQGGNLCTPKKWKTALWKILPSVLIKGMEYQGNSCFNEQPFRARKNNISGFKNFTPTKHWWEGLKRHPELALEKWTLFAPEC